MYLEWIETLLLFLRQNLDTIFLPLFICSEDETFILLSKFE